MLHSQKAFTSQPSSLSAKLPAPCAPRLRLKCKSSRSKAPAEVGKDGSLAQPTQAFQPSSLERRALLLTLPPLIGTALQQEESALAIQGGTAGRIPGRKMHGEICPPLGTLPH